MPTLTKSMDDQQPHRQASGVRPLCSGDGIVVTSRRPQTVSLSAEEILIFCVGEEKVLSRGEWGSVELCFWLRDHWLKVFRHLQKAEGSHLSSPWPCNGVDSHGFGLRNSVLAELSLNL